MVGVGVCVDSVVSQVPFIRSGLMFKCLCGVEEEGDSNFTWACVKGDLVLLCWDCTDSLHKQYMAEIADMDSNSLLEIAERAATFIGEAIEKEKEADDCN